MAVGDPAAGSRPATAAGATAVTEPVPAQPEPRGSRHALAWRLLWWVALPVLVVVAGVAAFLPTLDGYFLADDFGYVQLYWDQPLRAFPRLLAADWSQGIWDQPLDELRPIVALSFRLNTLLSGLDPTGYHVFNVAWHALASLLVLAIARRLIGAGALGAAFAALLFALLPAHAELVGWISGRVDVMTTAFALLALLGYGSWRQGRGAGWYVLALFAFTLALFTKEAALSFILLLPAWDVLAFGAPPTRSAPRAFSPAPRFGGGEPAGILARRPRNGVTPGTEREGGDSILASVADGGRLRAGGVSGGAFRAIRAAVARWLPFAVMLVVYLVLRRSAFPQPLRTNVLSLETLAEFAARQQFYLSSLLIPSDRLLDLPEPGVLDPAAVLLGGAALLLAALLALAGALLARRLPRGLRLALYFGPVWYLVTTLPLIVTYPSVRHLYLPSAGLCLVAACLAWPHFAAAWRPAVRASLAGLAAGLVLIAAWSATAARQADAAELAATSQAIHRSLLDAAARAPEGSRLVVVPEVRRGERWLWAWALPFAFQPPFTTGDLYERFDVVELPEAYCCPEWAWWRDRHGSVESWVAGDGLPTTLLRWHPPTHRLIERPILHAEVEQRLADLNAPTDGTITGSDALKLLPSFFWH